MTIKDSSDKKENNSNPIQNDFTVIKTTASSHIDKISSNNKECHKLINQYKNMIKKYGLSPNNLKTKNEDIEDTLYDALNDVIQFCIKYEKVIF